MSIGFGYVVVSQLVSDRSVQTFNDSSQAQTQLCAQTRGQPFFKCQSSSLYFLCDSVERIHWKTISRAIECQKFVTKLVKGVLWPTQTALNST